MQNVIKIILAIIVVLLLIGWGFSAIFEDHSNTELPAEYRDEELDCTDINSSIVKSVKDISNMEVLRYSVIIETTAEAQDSSALAQRLKCTALRVYREMGRARVWVRAISPSGEVLAGVKYAPKGDWAYQGDDQDVIGFRFQIQSI